MPTVHARAGGGGLGVGGVRGGLSDQSSVAGSDVDSHLPLPADRQMPSSKVQAVAGDIVQLEHRCAWLDQRNRWLTQRLLHSRRQFIERSLSSNTKGLIRKSFASWREAMRELMLERQLEEQTASLDQCQQVAKELGAALVQEKEARTYSDGMHMGFRHELSKALSAEKLLKRSFQQQQMQAALLERRVQEAEASLQRGRQQARAMLESVDAYDKKVREIEEEARDKRHPQPNTLQNSIQLREEAHGVMQKVAGLLRQPRPPSPEREP